MSNTQNYKLWQVDFDPAKKKQFVVIDSNDSMAQTYYLTSNVVMWTASTYLPYCPFLILPEGFGPWVENNLGRSWLVRNEKPQVIILSETNVLFRMPKEEFLLVKLTFM